MRFFPISLDPILPKGKPQTPRVRMICHRLLRHRLGGVSAHCNLYMYSCSHPSRFPPQPHCSPYARRSACPRPLQQPLYHHIRTAQHFATVFLSQVYTYYHKFQIERCYFYINTGYFKPADGKPSNLVSNPFFVPKL